MSRINVQLIEHTPNPEMVIASAAKLCYAGADIDDLLKKQTPESVDRFLNKLVEMGHESPIEHVSFTFGVEGVSRITEIQLVRHRIASYSIQSGRYVNRENPYFVVPPNIKASKLASARYEKVAIESRNAYNDIFLILMLTQMGVSDEDIEALSTDERIEAVAKLQHENRALYGKYEKIAIEDARYAHLQSLATKIILTMNARTLYNFFKHRCCTRAQWEINQLATLMLIKVKEVAPTLFKYSGPSCMSGICPEGSMCCGRSKEMKEYYSNIL